MKRKLKTFVMAFAITLSMFALAITVYAAVVTYRNTETKFLATLPSKTIDGAYYSAVGGIAVGKKQNSMFIVKADSKSDESDVLFYDFPSIQSPDVFHTYIIPMAGHANGMTISSKNVYICGWKSKKANLEDDESNNKILVIPRPLISVLRKTSGSYIRVDDYCKNNPSAPKYYTLQPKTKEVLADGSVRYTNYEDNIKTITMYTDDNSFIIGYSPINDDGTDNYIAYTIARLETYNDKTYFVVSKDPDDIFLVKNNVAHKGAMGQDICYAAGHGFFIPRWYGRDTTNPYYNPNKTVILWADIDGEYTYKTVDEVQYRYYVPDKIVIDKSKEKDSSNELLYKKFEPESIAFTKYGSLIFSCNTVVNGEATGGYKDAVFKLSHDGGQKFELE